MNKLLIGNFLQKCKWKFSEVFILIERDIYCIWNYNQNKNDCINFVNRKNLDLGIGVFIIKKEDAFVGCSGLTSITIPDSVTSIGDSAFWGCSGLEEIHFLWYKIAVESDFKGFFLEFQRAFILQSYLYRRRDFVIKYDRLVSTIYRIYYNKK